MACGPKGHAISIHALLAESDVTSVARVATTVISIHALLAESDEQAQSLKVAAHGISIHALLAESDSIAFKVIICLKDFYPRSPCGERPCGRRVGLPVAGHFYPRSPCGERL